MGRGFLSEPAVDRQGDDFHLQGVVPFFYMLGSRFWVILSSEFQLVRTVRRNPYLTDHACKTNPMVGKKRKKIVPVGNDLEMILGKQQWGNQYNLFSLVRCWSELAGREVASHSMPAYFRRDVLWVYVQGSIWMQQMQMVKPELLAKINAFLKGHQAVEDLRWMQQPPDLIDVPREEYVSPSISVDPAAERQFRVMAENIMDLDTREAFCNLWLRLTTKNKKQ